MTQVTYGGTMYATTKQAAKAWAHDALPDVSVIDENADPETCATADEAHWWTEASKTLETSEEHVQPEGLTESEWRTACRSALTDRIREALEARIAATGSTYPG